jgi:4-hydroxy-tetrahydrodipicolinate reductase
MVEGAVRVAVAGAKGRTGSIVSETLRQQSGIDLVATLVRDNAGADAQAFDDLTRLAQKTHPEVLVDFTTFPASKQIALQAVALGIRPVIGTSGYTTADISELREACQRAKIGAIYAPNFSIGAVLMMQFAKAAAPYFGHAEIVETHHTTKKDAPSGTALAAAQLIASAGHMQREKPTMLKADGATGADVGGVGIHSLRLPGVVGVHEIRFANHDETLVITHSTATRSAFVAGVIRAIRAVQSLDHLAVGLEELNT